MSARVTGLVWAALWRSALAMGSAGGMTTACAVGPESADHSLDAQAIDATRSEREINAEKTRRWRRRHLAHPWPAPSTETVEAQLHRINRWLDEQPSIANFDFSENRVEVDGSSLVVAYSHAGGGDDFVVWMADVSDLAPRAAPEVLPGGDNAIRLECWQNPPTRPDWSGRCWKANNRHISDAANADLDFNGDPVLGEAMLAALEQLVATLHAR